MKLTKAAVEAMRYQGRPPAGKDVRWDEKLAGFGLRVLPSGGKVFVFRYRTRTGRERYLTLGKFGPLSVDQARALALQAASQVSRGQDPAETRRRLRDGETVADLCRVYIDRHAKAHNKTWAKDQERVDLYVLPALGTLKVAAVQRGDVARLHQKIGKASPTTANRVLALVSSMWNRARLDFGLLPQTHPNPAEGIKRFAEVKRDRFVTADEMPALAAAIDEEPNEYVRVLIWMYLFTGLRKSELQTLRWKEVDMEAGRLRLGDTKAGRPHYLPVPAAGVALLKLLPRLAGNPYVFAGAVLGRHLVNVSKPWLRIRTRAGLLDVRLHDLRRTVGSWMAQGGYSLPLIGRVLNHSNQSTTAVYARFHLDPVSEALEETVGRINEAKTKKLEAHGASPSPSPDSTSSASGSGSTAAG